MQNLIVKKFGGSSLTNLSHVARLIKKDVERNYKVIAVVSAVAGFTDQMDLQARQISELSCKQELSEYDVILSAGEQISCGMLAIALRSIGISAKSWLSWQIPIITDDFYSESRIKTIEISNLKKSFTEGYSVAIIAGFQGVHNNRITTLGRGGSDISAVALAIAFNLKVCEIFTDIDGIYTTDPKLFPKARKLKSISYDEMLEISSSGAKILHIRSIQLAMKHNIQVKVLSSFEEGEGTAVLDKEDVLLENYKITGITYSIREALIIFADIADLLCILEDAAEANIRINMIYGSSLLISEFDIHSMKKISNNNCIINNDIAKVSVIGIGIMSNARILNSILKVVNKKKIEILAITSSEIKISLIIQKEFAETLVNDLHLELI